MLLYISGSTSPAGMLYLLQTTIDTSQAKVLDIPLQGGREEDFLDLLSACEEATFGRRKEVVLDPLYR
jgi:hypothetical protein